MKLKNILNRDANTLFVYSIAYFDINNESNDIWVWFEAENLVSQSAIQSGRNVYTNECLAWNTLWYLGEVQNEEVSKKEELKEYWRISQPLPVIVWDLTLNLCLKTTLVFTSAYT